jgi:hypothetical protein
MRNCLGLTADDVKRLFIALRGYKYVAMTEYVIYRPIRSHERVRYISIFSKILCVCEIMINDGGINID